MSPLSSPFVLAALDPLAILGIDKAWFTLTVVGIVFAALAFTTLTPDVILIAAAVVLLASGILTPSETLAGMSNEGMITVAVLFVVGAGVQETGAVNWITSRLFGRPKSVLSAVTRLSFPTMFLSGFMNNTPLVAMLIPAVNDLARANRLPVSKLMIPLSYAAILGGTCTLIGTSTNLVVKGLLLAENGHSLGMFDISWIGIPAAIVGGIYLIFTATYLLPDRKPALSTQDDMRQYTVEMQISADSPLAGKSIESAGLRHLPGLFLAEIDRDGTAIPAVSPQEVLHAGDRLLFVGAVESVVELQKIRGLVPATDDVFKLKSPRPQRCLIEAVVSNTCPFVGMTIRDSRFRNHYNAVVIAVARNGERLRQKIGDIVLRPGDVLLVEAHPSFADQHKNSHDFFLVSTVENSNPPRHELAIIAILLLAALVIVTTLEWVSVLVAAFVVAGLMLALRCVSMETARKSINWEVLLAIAASFALGKALEKTGAAELIATSATSLAQGNPWLTLAIIYYVTVLVTELITNNAAAALMFPFAMAAAAKLDVNYMPFVMAVMMAASAGFATPIGYQTNLMVYGPGGYKFADYVKIGLPLDILIGIVAVGLAPLVFPFEKG
jgi:di/tricarboxylate transporter